MQQFVNTHDVLVAYTGLLRGDPCPFIRDDPDHPVRTLQHWLLPSLTCFGESTDGDQIGILLAGYRSLD